ncbi:hypothetical protein AMJ47_02740 [Parcubacteria bacterium DG_72]|nr:MAG: hypothetical protein AMJ47_02740 [Parcubacteria bacterium DG_72]
MEIDKEIIAKLKNILDKMREEKNISLFIVILREDSNVWDLVIGGRNLDTKENLEWGVKIINKELDKDEVVLFSRLLLLNSDNPFVENINKSFRMPEGTVRIQNSKINNIAIKDAYLFYSKME